METKNRALVLSKDERIFKEIQQNLHNQAGVEGCEWKETLIAGLAVIREIKPVILFLDEEVCYPDVSSAVKEFTAKLPEMRIIFLAQMGRRDKIDAAILAGAVGYLLKPLDNIEVATTVQRVLVNFTPQPAAPIIETAICQTGKIISLFSTVDGVGKTTIAVNLAVLLAKLSGETVCLVDADLQFGDVCRFLSLNSPRTIADFVSDATNSGQSICEYLVNWNDLIDVLPAPKELEQSYSITPANMNAAIKELSCTYKYIVVDLPVGFAEVSVDVLEMANLILFVNTLDSISCVKNLRLGINTLRGLGYTEDKIHLILNRYKAKTAISVDEVEKAIHSRFAIKIGNDFSTTSEALQKNQPLVLYLPNREISQDLHKIAKQIAGDNMDKDVQITSSITDRLSRWLKG